MPSLTPRQQAFCQAYAAEPNGARAARAAGYGPTHAAHQASRLLKRPDIAARIAELGAAALERRAALADEQAAAARELAALLSPVYAANLDDKDYDGVLQTVELQARIRNLVSGGSTIRPRGPRPEPQARDAGANTYDPDNDCKKAFEIASCLADDVYKFRTALERLERIVTCMAEFVDPKDEVHLLRYYGDDEIAEDKAEGYFIDALYAEEREARERRARKANGKVHKSP